MRLAIMQPYLFPYVGYFQLIDAADVFVVYDDVSFTKRGWITRNYMLAHDGGRQLFTLQTAGASQNKRINEINIGDNRGKLLKTFKQQYVKAPQFSPVYQLLETILLSEERSLAVFLSRHLKLICKFLGIETNWVTSSELGAGTSLKGQERIIEICNALGAETYINATGGRALYEPAKFMESGLSLRFIDSSPVPYAQFGSDFEPSLSIVDVMMFNDVPACREILSRYSIVQ